ncbi:hypothetical protein PHSY_002569 [Pseudozyma hubeiensis SY62]|uniref:LIM zinc-binding domain-containing protein n=1 Tax=Pseudozyma hubeiensis (strain SY62) TaxID=1305764 RepID=R9P198_PSEHS|nr:hypothetical protein PHSY_002569 [Pseudozyma hubeiensis SY62]GAC94996.1 hypothetical protein PHSY_002569 [Pseudozyma hubeiensis SY62]
MSSAWLAHAPPPPPSTAVRKPRRSSSYEPLSFQKGSTVNDSHTRGGYLPPSSHSPEPPSSRRSSVSDLKEAAASSTTPASPIKRARSKVTSNPVPPAPSAFYNYQHQLQQQQHQQLYHRQPSPQQQQQPQQSAHVAQHLPYAAATDPAYAQAQQPIPTSVAMAHSYSDHNSGSSYAPYPRERRDSAPVISYSQTAHASIYAPQPPPSNGVLPVHPAAYDPTAAPAPASAYPYSAAQPPASYAMVNGVPATHLQHVPTHSAAISPHLTHYGVTPRQQQQPWVPAPHGQAPYQQAASPAQYSPITSPPLQQPWEHPGAIVTSPQQAGIAFPVSAGAPMSPLPPNVHVPPPMHVSSPPTSATSPQPPYVSELSRQSTASSVGSVRRPLPQPTRTSSNPSAPGSPITGPIGLTNRASVRRDLPRPPSSGSPATVSAGSSYVSSNLARASDPSSPGSPVAGTTSRLPASALNRTESVRLAAEALMARGVPQRRPLRSALASTTFSPPLPPTRIAANPELPASQSEPVAPSNGTPTRTVPQQYTDSPTTAVQAAHRASQSAGSALNRSIDASPVRARALPEPVSAQTADHTPASAPARFQDAPAQGPVPDVVYAQAPQSQPARRHEPARYQDTVQLVDSMVNMSVSQHDTAPASAAPGASTTAPSIPVFSFDAPEEEPEKPRRRRGSSVSRAGPPPGQKMIQQAPASAVAMPTIVLPGDDDDGSAVGPSIQISGADEDDASPNAGPMISVTADDDDARSQTSTGSKGPSISVSFSAEPSAKSQRAGTSHSASTNASPHQGSAGNGRVSASSVGSGAGCQGCRKWIAGKVVHALGTTYHPGCFVCAHCSEGLEHVAFYEHDGLPYCHFDYHELFSKRCFHCRTPIVDERYITVSDEELTGSDGETHERCYHELHFFCANCGDPFLDPKAAGSAAGSDPALMTADENGKVKHGGMEFIVHKGYPYCEKCHVNLHKPRCKGCKKPVLGDLISALGGKWHPECFTCSRCERVFEDTVFFVKDGRPYDEGCYKVLLRNMV